MINAGDSFPSGSKFKIPCSVNAVQHWQKSHTAVVTTKLVLTEELLFSVGKTVKAEGLRLNNQRLIVIQLKILLMTRDESLVCRNEFITGMLDGWGQARRILIESKHFILQHGTMVTPRFFNFAFRNLKHFLQ